MNYRGIQLIKPIKRYEGISLILWLDKVNSTATGAFNGIW